MLLDMRDALLPFLSCMTFKLQAASCCIIWEMGLHPCSLWGGAVLHALSG